MNMLGDQGKGRTGEMEEGWKQRRKERIREEDRDGGREQEHGGKM